MQILEKIWNEDGKYARKWSIKNCWLKADVLPPEMAALLQGTPNNAATSDLGTNASTVTQTLQNENVPAAENEFLPELIAALQRTNISVRNDSITSSVPTFESSIFTHEISTDNLYEAGKV